MQEAGRHEDVGRVARGADDFLARIEARPGRADRGLALGIVTNGRGHRASSGNVGESVARDGHLPTHPPQARTRPIASRAIPSWNVHLLERPTLRSQWWE